MLNEKPIAEGGFEAQGLYKRGGRSFDCPPKCLEMLRNVRIQHGRIKTIPGYAKMSANAIAANQVHSMKWCSKHDPSDTNSLIVGCGAGLYGFNTGTNNFDQIRAPAGLTPNLYTDIEVFNGTVYFMDGTNNPYKWAFTGAASVMTGPAQKCRFMLIHEARMLASGAATNADRCYFSAFNNVELWDSLGFFPMPPDWTGRELTGMVHNTYGEAIFFTRDSISRLTGIAPNDWVAKLLPSNGVGCYAPRTVVETRRGIFFASRDGFYLTNGGSPQCVSRDIQDYWDSINQTYLINAHAVLLNDEIFLFVPDAASTTINKCYVLDLGTLHCVSGPNDLPFDSACVGETNATYTGKLIGGAAASNGFVYSQTGYAFDNGAIASDIRTGTIRFPDTAWVEQLTLHAPTNQGAYNVTARLYPDLSATPVSLGDVSLAQTAYREGDHDTESVARTVIVHPIHASMNQTCRYAQFGFYHSGVSEPIEMFGWQIYGRPAKMK